MNSMTDYAAASANSLEKVYSKLPLHKLFEEQVDRSPEAIALSFRGESLTYAELDSLANKLAVEISAYISDSNKLIAICMDRSFEMVISLYAILKSGGAYVPLDPEYPDERLVFMLEDVDPSVVLTQSHLYRRIDSLVKSSVIIDYEMDRQDTSSTVKLETATNENNIAYVIFTSGSTGRPKGAINKHSGITNRIHWMQDAYQLTSDDIVLQKTPFSFDVSIWEFFSPLVVGARMVIAEPGGHRDNTHLIDTIIDSKITAIHFVPSMLQLFVEHPRVSECISLKRVFCSGEALPKVLQDRFFSKLPNTELHNLYGPTETAVEVTAWACDPQSKLSFVPIGKPIVNTQIHILDECMQPVSGNSVGEIYIGGVQVGAGYLNREELTAERFIPDPFSSLENARLYKTGDLARYLDDGNIEFLGRSDFQVKIRGFRVELGEIEAIIDACPDVRQSVVNSHQMPNGDLELVAYVATANKDKEFSESIRSQLSVKVPEHMVPATIMIVDSFALTNSGKVDRSALPSPKRERSNLNTPYVKASSQIEKYLAEQWQQLLNIDQIGINDRFFELGGTSLQAAAFINTMQEELGESIFVVSLFSAPSIAAYTDFLYTQYPSATSKRFGESSNHRVAEKSNSLITESDIERFQQCVPGLADNAVYEEPVNPSALFILSPPRSGTTLLRIMLAGHPDLFSSSELQLLGFHTLQERANAYTGKFSAWLDGTIRTIMEIKQCDAQTAKGIMCQFEQDQLSTKRFYGLLQSWAAPQTLVDKSPSYALDPAALQKAENDFEQPRYIHLVRDPRLMIESFKKHHMEQILYLHDHDFQSEQLAELVWTLSHRHIMNFLSKIPEHRWVRIKFEDLVSEPEITMQQLCSKMNLDYHQAVVDPYAGLEKKMIDGVFAESTPMGDPNFIKHGSIKSSKADVTACSIKASALGEPTRQLAQLLGYNLSEQTNQASPGRRANIGALRRQASRRRSGRRSSDE